MQSCSMRSLDELRGALGAAEHLGALVGRKFVLVAAVGSAREGRRGGRGRRPRQPQFLSAVRAVYLASLFGHRGEQLLRAFVCRPQR